MRSDFYYDSCCSGRIHGCRWTPDGNVRGVVQIVHGIAEHMGRYDAFARHLVSCGYLVVGEDHMGHGGSIGQGDITGYFNGGWFAAVEDTYALLKATHAEFPDVPYFLFGHSMGSFMVRTMLYRYSDAPIAGAVICGTGWQPGYLVGSGLVISKLCCRNGGERRPNAMLEKLIFGNYNNRIEHPRSKYDWLTRDQRIVDDYIADPLCGFPVTAGLARDLLTGISDIQKREHHEKMDKNLPVFFIAGGADPVGDYGRGVTHTADVFRNVGMKDVSLKLYPMDRHEILNELNRTDVFADICNWLREKIVK